MMKIYLLLVVSSMQPASWTLPAAYWSMHDCEVAMKERFPQGRSEAICVAFTSEEWKR